MDRLFNVWPVTADDAIHMLLQPARRLYIAKTVACRKTHAASTYKCSHGNKLQFLTPARGSGQSATTKDHR
jgi:hypothetical protein